MNNETKIIKKAYELTENVTPLKTDCGRICNSVCCKGDSETGMWLFPGEEEIFSEISDKEGFTIVPCEANFGYKAIVCTGHCERKLRPLACRIFPFFPMINEDGYDARADIRGVSLCPILYDNIKSDYSFIRQVRKIARLFDGNDEIRDYVKNINKMLDELSDFAERT